jgi:serine/threonine protein kinase
LNGAGVAIKLSLDEKTTTSHIQNEVTVRNQIISPDVFPILHFGFINQPKSSFHESYYTICPIADTTLYDMTVYDEYSSYLALKYIGEAANGIVSMHDAGFVHRDATGHNIFILSGKGYIADLGYASKLDIQNDNNYSVSGHVLNPMFQRPAMGSMGYIAPEHLENGTVTKDIDVFSLGVTAIYSLTGKFPWAELVDNNGKATNKSWDTYIAIIKNKRLEELPRYLPINLRDLIYSAIDPHPSKRPNMSQLADLANI